MQHQPVYNPAMPLRAYSKQELRELYGESARTFRMHYLNDPATLKDLQEAGYLSRTKYLSRKMVEIIVRHHCYPDL